MFPDSSHPGISMLLVTITLNGIVATAAAQSHREEPAPKTDPWAGKTVKNALHAQQMMHARVLNAPTVGEQAPEMTLHDASNGEAVEISSLYAKKPVVLYFASYSCMCSQKTAGFITDLHKTFGEQFQFLLVYIREAHPTGGLNAHASGVQFTVPDPQSLEERAAAALRFARERELDFPVFTDSMDDTLAVQWGAWPARLFVIDQKGTVVYAGQQGPWFVKPTSDFDLGVHGVFEPFRNLPGYSRESLEDFLVTYSKQPKTQ